MSVPVGPGARLGAMGALTAPASGNQAFGDALGMYNPRTDQVEARTPAAVQTERLFEFQMMTHTNAADARRLGGGLPLGGWR